jgi:hypothetical protein
LVLHRRPESSYIGYFVALTTPGLQRPADIIRLRLWDEPGLREDLLKLSRESTFPREFGVQMAEEASPDVGHKPSLRLIEQLLIWVCHARLIPRWQHGIENAGAGIEYFPDVLSPRTEV